MDVFRFIWGMLLEYFGYRTSYAILLVGQTLNAMITPSILDATAESTAATTILLRKCLYAFSLPCGRFLMGGHFVLHLVILVKMYGTTGGLRAWTVASTCSVLVNFINLFIIRFVYGDSNYLNFTQLCLIFGSLNILVLFILFFLYKGSKDKAKK